MNKTISIHLQGIPFLIEEEAYTQLKSYLDRLSEVLGKQDGAAEIIQDIELRMAELFSKSLIPNKKVLDHKMIQEVLLKLGNPDFFIISDEEQPTDSSKISENNQKEKRLFRDDENAVIGGVCAGLSCYFGIDVVFVRALIVLVSIFAGFGIPLYFVLWMIMPKAKTSIEKLQMKGEPVNFQNMKAEVEKTTEKLKNNSKKFADKLKEDKTIERSAKGMIRLVRVGFGIIFLLVGTLFFITFLSFLFIDPDFIPGQYNGEFISMGKLGQLIFESGRDTQNLYVGVILSSIGTIGLLWLLGIRLLVSLKSNVVKFSALGLTMLFFTGIILLVITGARTGRAFAVEGEVEKEIATTKSKELLMEFKTAPSKEQDGYRTLSKGESGILKVENGRIYLHGIEVLYEKSSDSLFHVYQLNSVQGKDHQSALRKARNLKLDIKQINNRLTCSAFFTFPLNDKLRDQKVKLIIKVPNQGLVKVNNQVVYPYLESKNKRLDEKSHAYIDGEGSYESW